MTENNFRDFVRGYIECMLWAEMDDDGHPLDLKYWPSDFDADSMAEIESACFGFCLLGEEYIHAIPKAPDGDSGWAWAGHLFWLSRNHHGTGFWDHGPELGNEALAARLDELAKRAGEVDVYVGDDGCLHVM